jgi:hypothetical protein
MNSNISERSNTNANIQFSHEKLKNLLPQTHLTEFMITHDSQLFSNTQLQHHISALLWA